MQRICFRRCIVSISVVYAKIPVTPYGATGIFCARDRTRKLNATVRWTVAHARLDGRDTLIERVPLSHQYPRNKF